MLQTIVMLILAVVPKVVVFDWTVNWVASVSPTDLFSRRAIGVNSQWPIPPIHIDIGDKLVIHVTNGLPDDCISQMYNCFSDINSFSWAIPK
jgi:iron transport multicopper oxidase